MSQSCLRSPTRSRFAAAGDVVEVGPWLHVLYEEGRTAAALKALVQKINADTTSILDADADADTKDEALQDVGERSYSDLAEIAHLIKGPGFAGEDEVRIVTTFFWAAKHIRYRAGSYGVMGYAELSALPLGRANFRVLPRADAVHPLPVKSVRLGLCCTSSTSSRSKASCETTT